MYEAIITLQHYFNPSFKNISPKCFPSNSNTLYKHNNLSSLTRTMINAFDKLRHESYRTLMEIEFYHLPVPV